MFPVVRKNTLANSAGQRKIRTRGAVVITAALLVVISAACDPVAPPEREYFSKRDEERRQREMVMRDANKNVSSEQLFNLVRDHAAPDKNGTMAKWLDRQLELLGGQIMFPKWTATRRGSNKQEIGFQFVHIDNENQMTRRSFTWQVDVLAMTVESPQLAGDASHAAPERAMVQSQERRLRTHEKELE